MRIFCCFLFFLALTSCSQDTFKIYSDEEYAARVNARFEEKKNLASARQSELFDVLDGTLTPAEKQGLTFLYAFMPLSDLADYDGKFFLNQVRWSLAARDTFSWGHSVPEDIFRHFVLPYRVNNENLDTARILIFNELKDRIRNLPMLQAALEVNHWCHEKVTYRGSDIRTSSPLASMKTAYGRCGEESTFTVAALRSVSIPARQVYTPRWAHSDDNHAWVEFWADGKWHYMGACEPECVPDLGWFTEPARRAMLIHTKAFGDYAGSERVENREKDYALINTLSVYAPVKEIFVKVISSDAQPVSEAGVEFQLYNYAEYYPISIKKTGGDGFTSFVTGLGDLMIWAYKENDFGWSKISVAHVDTLEIKLDQKPYAFREAGFDMEPPILRDPLAIPNDCRDNNNIRLRKEDSIRGAYEATFPSEVEAVKFAEEIGLDPDRVMPLVVKSRGNYQEIMNFLKSFAAQSGPAALDLCESVSEKDLRDTRATILADHLVRYQETGTHFSGELTEEVINQALLNPRVANEMLVSYRSYLLQSLGEELSQRFRRNPETLRDWILESIQLNEADNYYGTPLTPTGVFQLRHADEHSRKIFAVAVYRTLGIPSRLKAGTMEVEYFQNNGWNTLLFVREEKKSMKPATLVLSSDPSNPILPQYETHYTLAKYSGGKYHTLVYGYEFGDPLKQPLSLDPGFYALVTGNRQNGGKVLSQITWFELKEGETRRMPVTLRTGNQAPDILGHLKPAWKVSPLQGDTFLWPGKDVANFQVIAWIEPDKETTKHVFQDLGPLKKEIDKLDASFVFLIPKDKLTPGFTSQTWNNLPENSEFGIVDDLTSLSELEQALNKKVAGQWPVVTIVDSDGQIIYLSTGYKIGIGEELVKMIPVK